MTDHTAGARASAQRLVAALAGSDVTIATAESLTSGLVGAVLGELPGISEWYVGGVITYSHAMKSALLGVDPQRLEQEGAVTRDVALAMAHGCTRLTGARLAVATTGVAGPGPAEGQPAGSVWVALVDSVTGLARSRFLLSDGDRNHVRWQACHCALEMLGELVEQIHPEQR